jgi:hypothetical protein
METLDDLLIKRRRGSLSADDARRLRAQVRRSPELELALAAGLAFDHLDTNAPGDAELIQHIASAAERRWSTSKRPHAFLGRAAVPLILATAATAWATSQWLIHSPQHPLQLPSIPTVTAPAAAAATTPAPAPALYPCPYPCLSH